MATSIFVCNIRYGVLPMGEENSLLSSALHPSPRATFPFASPPTVTWKLWLDPYPVLILFWLYKYVCLSQIVPKIAFPSLNNFYFAWSWRLPVIFHGLGSYHEVNPQLPLKYVNIFYYFQTMKFMLSFIFLKRISLSWLLYLISSCYSGVSLHYHFSGISGESKVSASVPFAIVSHKSLFSFGSFLMSLRTFTHAVFSFSNLLPVFDWSLLIRQLWA